MAAGGAAESGIRNRKLEDKIQKLIEDAETGRTGGARHVTFRIHRPQSGSDASKEDDKGYVFFHSLLPHLGGPLAFMSNSWKSGFQVKEAREGFTVHVAHELDNVAIHDFIRAKGCGGLTGVFSVDPSKQRS